MDKIPDRHSARQLLWHQNLVQCACEIDLQLRLLSQARYAAMGLLLRRKSNGVAEILIDVVNHAVRFLDTLAPGDFRYRALHPEVYSATDHVTALCNPAVEGEWLRKGYVHALRETLRAILLLLSIYEHLSVMARHDSGILMRKEYLWILHLFLLVSTDDE